MRVAAVQFDIVWEDKPANHAVIEGMIAEAGIEPGTFILLPEMGDTGFSFDLDRIVDDRSLEWGRRVARDRGIWLQVGHAQRGEDGRGRNCATIISPDGTTRGAYEKVHPFSYGREMVHFSGGEHLTLCDIPDAGPDDRREEGPGDEQKTDDDLQKTTICPLICYDLRFPELWRLAARAGAEVFTIGANWPTARLEHWRALLIARAIENQAFIVAVNRIGRDPRIEYAGGSIIVGPTGEVLAEAGDEPVILCADLGLDELRSWRRTFPALDDIHDELLGSVRIDGDG